MMENWLRDFETGHAYRAYEVLGAHLTADGALFRVWAPSALSVSLVGEFSGWTPGSHMMTPCPGGLWELSIPGLKPGEKYKYAIETRDGSVLWKADPYAFQAETRPETASIVCDLEGFNWADDEWMERRRAQPVYESPVNVYEVHPGSWRRHEDGGFYSYRELALELIPYVKDLGFTHIELMPVTEHPYDGSWGYQCTGYFAATSRYGTPHDLMYFINECHRAGIGVIMDWAPAHFPKDAHGLMAFDGSRCYEYEHSVKGEHPSWGTRVFDFGKGQVRSFLISSAMFWLTVFHIDGLRVDAVASMLYLDYDRKPGQWQPNRFGGKENLEAIEFLRLLNEAVFGADGSVMMIAEESTAWPLVTAPVYAGGLGFNMKWNMGWMNDILTYVKMDPIFRAGNHRNLTFSFFYAFSENFLLPLSHDEVVHMKGSLYNKMPGGKDMKLAGVRVFWAYMLAHPGKKLLFMGAELGQQTEWDYMSQIGWAKLEDGRNVKLLDFFKDANRFYAAHPELWEQDFSADGFRWIAPDETEANVAAFIRRDRSGRELIFVCSFSGSARLKFRLGLPAKGEYELLFSTDSAAYGGSGKLKKTLKTENVPWHYLAQSVTLDLPPLTGLFLCKTEDRGERTEDRSERIEDERGENL